MTSRFLSARFLVQVLATNGDTHLGGQDFDQRVMEYFMKMFKKKTGTDLKGDNRAIQKLRREVGFPLQPLQYECYVETDWWEAI